MKLFHNAQLPTPATALAIRGGRIAVIGSVDHCRVALPPGAEEVDCGGRTILPGFNDAHVHTWKVGHLRTTMIDLRGCASLGNMSDRLAEFATGLAPGAWVQSRGWNEATLAEGRMPTRADLDRVLPDRPVFSIRTCAHIAVANSRALELAGITRDTVAPPGGHIEKDASGEPNGLLHETALGLVQRVMPPPTQADLEAMIRAGQEHQLSVGITSATDPAVTPALMAAYRALDARGELLNRHNLLAIRRPDGGTETFPLPEEYGSDFLRIAGVKFFADGGLSGATAALSVDYRHAPTRGILRFEDDELFALARPAHEHGLRIGIHAIGDRAIEQVLALYERLGSGPRHRIEHFGLPNADHLHRAAALGAMAVSQPTFLRELAGNFRRYLPDGWLGRAYPLRAMVDAGITVALSSDAPVVRDDNPILSMQAAVTRRAAGGGETLAPEQALTLEEALRGYTLGGAEASGDEANRGTLEPGKWADFVILDGDPFEVGAERLHEVVVRETWVGGERRYRRPEATAQREAPGKASGAAG
ncbi:MAG: amidohydrolase [Sumerlaeia bacterium]